jgi:hypothetical protein
MSGTALLILAPNSAVVMSDEKENIFKERQIQESDWRGKAQRFNHEKNSKRTN